MKIDVKLPGGLEMHIEREPMDKERFEASCWLIGVSSVVISIAIVLITVFG